MLDCEKSLLACYEVGNIAIQCVQNVDLGEYFIHKCDEAFRPVWYDYEEGNVLNISLLLFTCHFCTFEMVCTVHIKTLKPHTVLGNSCVCPALQIKSASYSCYSSCLTNKVCVLLFSAVTVRARESN